MPGTSVLSRKRRAVPCPNTRNRDIYTINFSMLNGGLEAAARAVETGLLIGEEVYVLGRRRCFQAGRPSRGDL